MGMCCASALGALPERTATDTAESGTSSEEDGDWQGRRRQSSGAESSSSEFASEYSMASTDNSEVRNASADATWARLASGAQAAVSRLASTQPVVDRPVSDLSSGSGGTLVTLAFSMAPTSELRAVPMRLLLRDAGHIWSSSQASKATAGASPWFKVEEYDTFVSHSWSAGRLGKYLTLLLICNGRAALAVGMLCGPLMGLLEVLFNFPEITEWVDVMKVDGSSYSTKFRWWAEIVGFVATVVVVLYWQLGEGWCWRRRSVFLDKVCIEQDDPQMKLKGIRSLPGFLSCTDTLLVLWSKQYLSRLWCVLELATWVHLKKRNILFAPLMSAQTILTFFVWMQFAGLASSVYQAFGVDARGKLISYWAPIVVLLAVAQAMLRRLMQDRLALDAQLKSFDCLNAQCSAEEDRELILAQIENWFGARISGEGGAYRYFNRVVRTSVYKQLHARSGNAARLRYDWVLLACLPVWWRWCDITASAAEGGLPLKNVVNMAVHGCFRTFCYAPLLMQIFMWFNVWLASTQFGVLLEALRFLAVCFSICLLDFAGELMANAVLAADSFLITVGVNSALLLLTVTVYSAKVRWQARLWLYGGSDEPPFEE